MDMNMAWLTYPLQLHGSREFECGDFTTAECDYYKERWHFWYIADYVFALPTVAFFMSAIGIFILGHVFSTYVVGHRHAQGGIFWRKLIALIRYTSYRRGHVSVLRWNTAPVGVLILGLAGAVFFFCMVLAPQPYYWSDEKFGGSPPLATRSGWLALGCMPFVFATATKSNWITLVTGVSHEKLQVFHRWIAYAFFVLALLHTFPFIVYHIHWHDMEDHFSSSLLFYWTGIVAIIFQAWLTFMSHSTIRSLLGYEFFKATHFLAVIVFIITFFWHCDYTLTSWDYFIATAAIYVPCSAYSWLRIMFEYGYTQKAQITVQENGFTRIAIPAKFNWSPGQHCFLRFTSFGFFAALSSHPFTICSSPSIEPGNPSQIVFYIRSHKGFTAKLYQHALDFPGATVPVQVDGPYGGINLQRFRDSEHILIVAGGSGAGWILPFVERFARYGLARQTAGSGNNDPEKNIVGTGTDYSAGGRSLRIVLATRDLGSRIWFLRVVDELLARYPDSRPQIHVHLTSDAQSSTSSEVEQMPPASSDGLELPIDKTEGHVKAREALGRPHLAATIEEEAQKASATGTALAVYVCGPSTMQKDVSDAVAAENLKIVKGAGGIGVYLHSEHFSWA